LKFEKIILGVDPGTTIMGYGIIGVIAKKATLIAMGHIDLTKISGHYAKLKHIFERSSALIANYKPDELAIEAPFLDKNVQVAIKLGRAQGTVMIAALNQNIPIYEYAPLKIKMALTGNGQASKEQVAGMLQQIFKIEKMPSKLDATDGLAAAYCHFIQPEYTKGKSSAKSWADFVKKNPNRIKGGFKK